MRLTAPQRFLSVLTLSLVATGAIPFGTGASAAEPAKPAAKDKVIAIAEVKRTEPVDFQKDVLPILKKSCLACHNATQKESDLVLESPQSILKGGASGSAVDLKNPKESLLLGRATGEVDGIMPPKGNKVAAPNLKPAELGLIKLWIEQGATGSVSGVAEALDWQPLPAGVNPIYAVALTADGQFAACGRANQVFIYHVPSGRFVCRLTDPELIKIGMYSKAGVADRDIIQSLALSPDGSLLATGGYRDVKLWRRPRNVKVGSLEALADQTQTLAVSPDGKWAAGGGADGLVKIWDLSNGKVAKTLKGHTAAITCVRFAADGAKLFSGSLDKSIRIWNVADGAPAGQIDTPSAVNALTLVTGATPIVSGGADNKVRLWTLPAGATPQFASPAPLKVLAYSPDKKSLAIGGADGKIKLVEVGTGKEIKVLTGQNGAITALAYQADGQKLVSASSDNSVRVWDVNAGASLATLEGCPSPAESIALHPQTKQVVAGLADGTLVLWKLENPKPEEPVKDPDTKLLAKSNGKISGLVFSTDASTLYVASADGTLRGLQTAGGKQKFSANHGVPIHALAVSLDGKTLATGGEDKMIKIWNSANGAAGAKPQMAGLNGPVKRVAFSRDNAKVIGSAGKEALVFQLATAEVEQGFNEHGGDILALGSSGEPAEVIVSAGADNTVRSWGLLAGKQLAGHTQPVTCLDTFASAPTQIASGSADGNVRVWTTDNGQSPRQFNHGGPISGIAIRPDGQRVASAGLNKSVKLWNATNNQMVAEMKGDYRAIAHVAAVERRLNLAKANVASEKTELAAAEKTVTAENDAVKKAKDAKTAADKTLGEKVEPAKKATDEKNVADKASTEAAAEDKKAQDAKIAAEKALADADAASKAAAEKAKLAQEAAKKEADNKTLAEAQVAADKAAQEAADKLKAAQTAKADAEKKATETAQKAKQAADAAMAKLKPAEDAEKARKDAETAAQAATRALAASEAAAKRATDAVPKAKDELAAAEAAVKKSETDLEAAKKAATETEQPFRAVAFSPDGAEIAVAGEDKLVHTYSGETGAAFDVYTSHAGPVLAVAYVGPSKLISGGADKTGVIWDLNPTWTLERTIGTAETSVLMDRVTALAFSPDGKLLATGSGDPSRSGELKLWNTADGSLAREVKDAHSDTVLGIEFSPNGQYVASCAADKFVKVFETATGKFVRSFEGHTHHVLGVTWRIDGKTLASCGADNVIKVWDFETGDQRRTIQGFTKEVTSIRFIGDTPNTVASSGDKTVRMANVDNGGMVRTFSGGGDFMYSAAATIDGKVIVAGGQDSVLRAWNGDNGQELRTFPAPTPEGDQQANAKK